MSLSYVTYCTAIERETHRFVQVTAGADPATPVPACPGWALTDLIRHTGNLQRWFTVLLRDLAQQRPARPEIDPDLPSDPAAYPGWLTAGVTAAGAVLRVTDPDAPMWAWGPDKHARFWARRMLFETLVHRADAELALGLNPGIDAELAADGVDEFLTNLPSALPFAPQVAGLRGADEVIRFECTDVDRQWAVRLRPDGFGLDPDGEAPHASIRATAADLLLFVYGRPAPAGRAVTRLGDEALITRWCTNSRF
ncbi:maleylpyruvate isomerase family mycothiol-dependent enzyme [Krasilnikovia sp. MM14-A1259]|uniref:maleylpyruvate isomerase family mycothiol-dependent enzyme n=1 Tax=Krasilnikovia sp. MM14-A1259 TaxID=3373539 RepID=UPI00381FF44F